MSLVLRVYRTACCILSHPVVSSCTEQRLTTLRGSRLITHHSPACITQRLCAANLAMVVFTNLGTEAGLICKPQLRLVTKPRCGEAVSRNPINKAFTSNGFPRSRRPTYLPNFVKGILTRFDVLAPPRMGLLGVDFLLTTCRSNITSLSIRSEDFGDGFCSNRSETGSAHCYHEGNATTHVCRRKPCLATGDY